MKSKKTMNKKNRVSATIKLALTMMVLSAVMSMVFIMANIKSGIAIHEEAILSKGEYIASQVAALSEIPLYSGEADEIQQQLEGMFGQESGPYHDVMSIMVNNLEGVTVASYIWGERESFATPDSLNVVKSNIGVKDAVVGEVLVEVSMKSRLDVLYRESAKASFLIVGVLAILFLALFFWVNKYVFKGPIRQISLALKRFYSDGDYQLSMKGKYPTEYDPVVDSLVKMADQIRGHKNALQSEVDEATKTLKEKNKELVFANKQAEIANRHKNDFTAKMTHELRTPTAAIYSIAQTLLRGEKGLSRKGREQVENVFEASQSLLREINELSTINRLDKSGKKGEISEIDVVQVVRNEIKIHLQDLYRKGLQYYFTVGRYVSDFINTDEKMIEYIVRNLLGNAIKFTDKGVIGIRLDMSQGDNCDLLHITVRDTGIGIPASEHEKVFEEYYQLDEGLTRKYDGTGLGLSTVKKYVDGVGGKIEVSSAINRGSQFRITIPCTRSSKSRGGRFEVGMMLNRAGLKPFFLRSGQRYDEMVHGLCDRWALEVSFVDNEDGLLPKNSVLVVHNAFDLPDAGLSLCEKHGVDKIISLNTKLNCDERYDTEAPHILGNLNGLSTRSDVEDIVGRYMASKPSVPVDEETDLIEQVNEGWSGLLGEVPEQPPLLEGFNILIVDDNKQAQAASESVCESFGASVDTAWNGKDAIRHCMAKQYDCILMDIMMPGQDGVSVTEEIRTLAKNKNTPVIALTASTSSLNGRNLDVFATTAEKPLNVDLIVGIINQAMAANRYQLDSVAIPKKLNY